MIIIVRQTGNVFPKLQVDRTLTTPTWEAVKVIKVLLLISNSSYMQNNLILGFASNWPAGVYCRINPVKVIRTNYKDIFYYLSSVRNVFPYSSVVKHFVSIGNTFKHTFSLIHL